MIASAALSGSCADLGVGVPLPALQTPALTVAPGVAEAAIRALTTLFAQARANGQLLAQAQRDVRELATALSQEHPPDGGPDDLTILLSIPGVGIYVASTLLAEAPRSDPPSRLPRAPSPQRRGAGQGGLRKE